MAANVEAGTAGEAMGTGEQIRSMKGEPETVSSSGRKMADHGNVMSQLATQLRTIKDSEMSDWRITGKAAEKLRSSIGDAAERIAVAGAIYGPIGIALRDYGSDACGYQDELNSLAEQCQERWTTLKALRGEYADGEAPVVGDPDYDEQLEKRQQLQADIWEADGAWSEVAVQWNNLSVDWGMVYDQAVSCLSDPDLEAIRSGEKVPGDGASTLYPNGDPIPEDVHQGGAGDCYLLAVLAGLADGDPQKIRDMITVNPDGTYTVHFADGDITVSSDQLLDNDQADWVRVIEAAYVEHEGSYDEFNNGGWPHDVMEDIFGHGADKKDDDSSFWDFATGGNDIDDSYDEMQDALDSGRPVAAAATNGQLGFDGGGHALTVTDTYEVDGTRYVVIRNPWGHNNGHGGDITDAGGVLNDPDDGYFTMTMEEFANSFSDVAIANR
ncbi:C2 family cysteine protease [Microbacterium aurantiacum]|uniref:C2 family cysteine protease n=1 Tax=Microbacterium aurantiacum TaxID=162393 RepID=UPI0011AF6127|nr:C2 family cysteine protease [Microbacterium aurantiacum]